jgi:hypothetical protein
MLTFKKFGSYQAVKWKSKIPTTGKRGASPITVNGIAKMPCIFAMPLI